MILIESPQTLTFCLAYSNLVQSAEETHEWIDEGHEEQTDPPIVAKDRQGNARPWNSDVAQVVDHILLEVL